MSLIETAKSLLEKGMILKDEELIYMANELLKELDERPEDSTTEEKPKAVTVDEDFTVKPDSSSSGDKRSKSQKLHLGSRVNKFEDTKTEHLDIITPDVKPVERHRSDHKTVNQTCRVCKKTFDVDSVHKREWFVCNSCIRK